MNSPKISSFEGEKLSYFPVISQPLTFNRKIEKFSRPGHFQFLPLSGTERINSETVLATLKRNYKILIPAFMIRLYFLALFSLKLAINFDGITSVDDALNSGHFYLKLILSDVLIAQNFSLE